jgi:signal transduction histidine kinase
VRRFMRTLGDGLRLRPPQLLALVFALMIGAAVGLASYSVRGLVCVQALIAAIGFWGLRRGYTRSRALDRLENAKSAKLLERLSIATQAAGIYCWELDWSTYSIAWDAARLPPEEVAAASRRHFGFELGSDLFKWVHPEDQHAGGKAIAESLARGDNHVSFRYRIVLPDQSIRHVQAFARTYADAHGKPQRSVGVSWDVTEEVEAAQRRARDSEKERDLLERLSVATHAAGLQCWEYDFRKAQLTWLDNDLGTRGQGVQDLGDAQFALIFPEDLQEVTLKSEAARKRREPMMSAIYRRSDPDGTVHYVQNYQRFFYDESGTATRALGANIDITESQRRQVELEMLSIRIGIASRAAQAGVWEWQERTDEIWWNDTLYTIYGVSTDTFRPTYGNVCGLIHPDDVAHAEAAWAEALQAPNPLHVEFRVVRPDGAIVHLDTLASMVVGSHDSDRRLVGITLDISRRVAAEQRERQLQKQLVEASHLSGMAEVATGVLHNVGNVLNSLGISASTAQAHVQTSPFERIERIATMLDEYRNRVGNQDSDSRVKVIPEYLRALSTQMRRDCDVVRHEIEAINGHVQYLREIIQAQQSFARVGGAEEAVNVRELVEGALTLKSQELKGTTVTRDIPEMTEVWTDRYKLLQVIINFVTNACDSMAASGSRDRRMAVRARLVEGELEISVEDSGVGISPDMMERIWEFGFTTKAHGHGFGLHSSAVAAQQLGGTVTAESDGAGNGARFAVSIPVRTEVSRRALSV